MFDDGETENHCSFFHFWTSSFSLGVGYLMMVKLKFAIVDLVLLITDCLMMKT